MSHYAEYQKEICGAETIESSFGFTTYVEVPNALFINDMWVAPEHRREGIGLKMLERVRQIAAERQKEWVLATVDTNTRTATMSLTAQLAAGFVPYNAQDGKIYMRISSKGE